MTATLWPCVGEGAGAGEADAAVAAGDEHDSARGVGHRATSGRWPSQRSSGAGPAHAGAEADEQHEVAVARRGRRRGRRRGPAGSMAAEVLPVACRTVATRSVRDAEALARRLDDADVGLVGDDEGDVVGGDAGGGHRGAGRVDHHRDGPAEDLLAVHRACSRRCRRIEQLAGGAVGAEVEREQLAGPVDGLEHHGAGAVAEEDGGVAVVLVGDAAQGLGPDRAAPGRMPMAMSPWACTRP